MSEGKLDCRVKEFVFLDIKRNLKGYKSWDNKNKKFVLSRYVTFDEILMSRSNSQQVKRMKTKALRSGWMIMLLHVI